MWKASAGHNIKTSIDNDDDDDWETDPDFVVSIILKVVLLLGYTQLDSQG